MTAVQHQVTQSSYTVLACCEHATTDEQLIVTVRATAEHMTGVRCMTSIEQ